MSTKNQLPEGLRFISAEAEKFKNLGTIHIDIGGRSILVIGKNEAGKSSFIQLLTGSANSKNLPSEPIQTGEEKAKTSVKIGGNINGQWKEYVVDMYFTPKNKSGRLVVTNENGENVPSPATFIKSLIGNVSFDVMGWMSQSKEKKLQILKTLTGCGDQIDTLTFQIKEAKNSKKAKLDRAEELSAILNNKRYNPEEIDRYSNPIDMAPLLEESNAVSNNIATYSQVENKINTLNSEIQNCINQANSSNEKISFANNEINRLLQEVERQKSIIANEENNINNQKAAIDEKQITIGKCNEWLSTRERPSSESINNRIAEATKHNEHCNNIGILGQQHREMTKCKGEAEEFDATLKKLEKERSDIISKSQLPIKGLSFTDEEILLDGVPMEEGQINTARLFDVGVDVAIAMNPTLKAIFLHDGSLFDKHSLRTIVEKIENRGYQAIVEMVNYEGGELEIKFTEEELK